MHLVMKKEAEIRVTFSLVSIQRASIASILLKYIRFSRTMMRRLNNRWSLFTCRFYFSSICGLSQHTVTGSEIFSWREEEEASVCTVSNVSMLSPPTCIDFLRSLMRPDCGGKMVWGKLCVQTITLLHLPHHHHRHSGVRIRSEFETMHWKLKRTCKCVVLLPPMQHIAVICV